MFTPRLRDSASWLLLVEEACSRNPGIEPLPTNHAEAYNGITVIVVIARAVSDPQNQDP